MTNASDRIPSLSEFVDGLSTKHARDLIEQMLTAYAYRQKEAAEEDKYRGRTAQKRLAAVLRDADADWYVREHVLNAGRALYLYEGERHNYYGEELLELVLRAAGDAGSSEGPAFAQAMERLRAEMATNFTGPELIEANVAVVKIASRIINGVLDAKGFIYFSPSERSVLLGIVDVPTVRRLSTRPDENAAE